MQRTLIGASLATLLLAGPAFAQSTTAPSRPATPPAPAPAQAPAEKMQTPSTNATTPAPRAQNTPMRDQTASDMTFRASKLIGSTVYNNTNENIGEINEILLDSTGKVAQVVIGVGGFLGIGERNVAVPFTDLKLTQDGSTTKVMSSYNKDSLKNMPAWTWRDPAVRK